MVELDEGGYLQLQVFGFHCLQDNLEDMVRLSFSADDRIGSESNTFSPEESSKGF